MRSLFLGVGNLQRGDDGVGPFIAQELAQDPFLQKQKVEVLPHSGEGASLMHLWDEADHVVIVDCMKSGQRLGSVHRFDAVKQKLHSGVFRYSSHLFGLAEAVETARALDRLPRSLIIYGIEGREFEFGSSFSPSVKKAVASVLKKVRAEFGAEE